MAVNASSSCGSGTVPLTRPGAHNTHSKHSLTWFTRKPGANNTHSKHSLTWFTRQPGAHNTHSKHSLTWFNRQPGAHNTHAHSKHSLTWFTRQPVWNSTSMLYMKQHQYAAHHAVYGYSMSYTAYCFTGIFYADVRQISMLFIDNKDSVSCRLWKQLQPCAYYSVYGNSTNYTAYQCVYGNSTNHTAYNMPSMETAPIVPHILTRMETPWPPIILHIMVNGNSTNHTSSYVWKQHQLYRIPHSNIVETYLPTWIVASQAWDLTQCNKWQTVCSNSDVAQYPHWRQITTAGPRERWLRKHQN